MNFDTLLIALQALLPILAPLIASGIVYLVNKGAALISGWPNFAKQGLLVVLTFAITYGANLLGVQVAGGGLLEWGQADWQSLVGGIAAALLYKLGQRGRAIPA